MVQNERANGNPFSPMHLPVMLPVPSLSLLLLPVAADKGLTPVKKGATLAPVLHENQSSEVSAVLCPFSFSVALLSA